ncbi:hypothetical protein PASE110613_00880 [Paenibacillus sediminis]|uniref:Lipid-binding transport protein (Tim44 family) n=1 Tax=Paenibacillus sediminis TaxID=664909 RepID=A0ABS4H017_9BACL|nr:hypothetical protein [Paenibacillus sediminis]MBP1935864.1 putative lipid-binding transport protein (Tim44 family) [Paenibacillus sediminis]
MRKLMLIFMAFTLFFAMTVPGTVDAKRGSGGYKSGTKSFTSTPKKATDSHVQKSDSTTSTNKTTGAGTTTSRGFFSGGSFMKGLMIGGIAGLLFGGLFSNLGFMGDILGLFINMIAIYVLFIVIRAVFRAYKNRHKPADSYRRY